MGCAEVGCVSDILPRAQVLSRCRKRTTQGCDHIAEMPSLPFLLVIGALGAAAAIAMALAKPLAEEAVEQMGMEPTFEI